MEGRSTVLDIYVLLKNKDYFSERMIDFLLNCFNYQILFKQRPERKLKPGNEQKN